MMTLTASRMRWHLARCFHFLATRLSLAGLIALAVVIGSAFALAEESEPAKPRRYDAGPLTVADFKGEVPQSLPVVGRIRRLAYTKSDLNYRMRYDILPQREGVDVQLTQLSIHAVLVAEESWYSPEAPAGLLDHEQGHFDISQAYALEMQLAWLQMQKEGKSIVGQGPNQRLAIADLHQRILAFLTTGYQRTAQAHADYDRLTRHGSSPAAQRRQRMAQIALLNELIEKLKGEQVRSE